jgi:glutamine amidotransferase
MGIHEGLGLLSGKVVRFDDQLKVPHIGWNQLDIVEANGRHPLLQDIPDHSYAYFVHSYYASAEPDCVLTTTEYGIRFASIVGKDNVCGAQPHPEKSQEIGLKLLRNFAAIVRASIEQEGQS